MTGGKYFISDVDVSSPGNQHLQALDVVPCSSTVQWSLIVLSTTYIMFRKKVQFILDITFAIVDRFSKIHLLTDSQGN